MPWPSGWKALWTPPWGGAFLGEVGHFLFHDAGIAVHRQRSHMHEVTNGIVGQEDAVEFLQHSARCAAAKMHQAIELMGLEFVIPDFDLPSLVIKHHEFRGRG